MDLKKGYSWVFQDIALCNWPQNAATEQSELSISECHVITLINDLLGHSKSVFKGF